MTQHAPLDLHRVRSSLPHLRRALASGVVRLGFLGGSITDQKTRERWPEPFVAWFLSAFPGVRVVVENAAIGATGSDLAAFRARRDILARDCDLVFVEYAVNDHGTPPARRARAREGLLRQLLAAPLDVVLVHTFMPEHLADLDADRPPQSVSDFDNIAAHYGVGSAYAGLHALREHRAGLLRWEDWLPDNLHPGSRGSLSYARAVIDHVEQALNLPVSSSGPHAPGALPPPLDPLCWETVSTLPFADIRRSGPWSERRWGQLNWIDQVLHTTAPGATLCATFTGHTLIAAFDFGKSSSEFRWRIDLGEWQKTDRERPSWCGEAGWFRPEVLAEKLSPGSHRLDIEFFRSTRPEVTGCTTNLVFLGTVD